MARRRWLLTGATGGLGRALQCLFPHRFPNEDLFCLSSKILVSPNGQNQSCNITNYSEIIEIASHVKPDAIIHCAAISHPLDCERYPEQAMIVNRDFSRALSIYAKKFSAWMLYCSTDFVFSGSSSGMYSETDHPEPLNIYGKSKLAGENELLQQESGLVARLSLMFDPPLGGKTKSWSKLRNQLDLHTDVSGVVNEWRTPLSYSSAASILLKLADLKRYGIVHVGGPERMSPYELIVKLRAEIGSRSKILPIYTRDFEHGYARPRNVSLSTRKLNEWLEAYTPAEMTTSANQGHAK